VGSVFALAAVSTSSTARVAGAGYGVGPVVGTGAGRVLVDGKPFARGVIRYGAGVALAPGARLTLRADVGTILLYPPPGRSIQFVLVRSSDVFTLGLLDSPAAKPKRQSVVEIDLRGKSFGGCLASRPSPKSKGGAVGRRLWARGNGRFRTVGRYASATVAGVGNWLTNDLCDGTLMTVKQGTLKLTNFPLRKVIFLTAPNTYLAKPLLRVLCSLSTSLQHHVEITCAAGRRNAARPYDIVVRGRVVARGTVPATGSFVARFTATLAPGTPVTVRIGGSAVAAVRA
jgi:hypothetical protein